jgi:hypothetical protein
VRRIFVPSRGVSDWRALLADPDGQWETGFSAKALAYCWEEADGFPHSVRAAFGASAFPLFHKIELLLALPEHKVRLPGGRRASQTDLFALGKSEDELVSIAVEGKVAESFGERVEDWIERRAAEEERRGRTRAPTAGAQERLRYLCALVGLREDEVSDLRYQLLHRTASALIEAQRFNARHALMLVHSFSQTKPPMCLDDFERFAMRLKCEDAGAGTLAFVGQRDGIDLYLGWARGEARYLAV